MSSMRPAPYKPVQLNPIDQRKWEDTLAAMSWIAPGFVHIIYTMLSNTSNKAVALFTEDINYIAATDGFQLIFTPSQYFKLDLMERVFIGLHEVCHEILNHCRAGYGYRLIGKITLAGKVLPYSHMFAGYMQDFIINDMLIKSKFGTMPKGVAAGLHNEDIATQGDDWVTAYFRNWKDPQCKPMGGGKKPGEGGSGTPQSSDGTDTPDKGRFDAHLDPHRSEGKDPTEAPARREAEWDLAVKAAMEIQRAQGKLPASMEQFFTAILQPKVSWSEHIKGLVLRVMGSGAYDWRKLDRRLIVRGIGAPGLAGRTIDTLVLGADSSGSIYQDPTLINRWFAELSGILDECNPRVIYLVWCDAAIQRVDTLEGAEDLREVYNKGSKGGGGTSFCPVFEWVDSEGINPDMMLYLTDGDGMFPAHEPDYPVIWGDITNSPKKYPFGAVVQVPVQQDD